MFQPAPALQRQFDLPDALLQGHVHLFNQFGFQVPVRNFSMTHLVALDGVHDGALIGGGIGVYRQAVVGPHRFRRAESCVP